MPMLVALLLAALATYWFGERPPAPVEVAPSVAVAPNGPSADAWQSGCQERFERAKEQLGFVMGEDELAQRLQHSTRSDPHANGAVGLILGKQYMARVGPNDPTRAERSSEHAEPDQEWTTTVDEQTGVHVLARRTRGHAATIMVDARRVGYDRFERFATLFMPAIDDCLAMGAPSEPRHEPIDVEILPPR